LAVDDLSTTQGIVALVAGGLALLALVLCGVLFVKLRRLRSAQRVVLGQGETRDLIAHGARLEQGFVDLREWVDEALEQLGMRVGTAEGRLDHALSYRSLVRYDAYNEMSGRQSSSVAFLDEHRSGIVMSAILHRDQARLYVKPVHEGESELELSPEERQAIDTAVQHGPVDVSAA
jgi:Protein of unknown function (DUF4446)